MKKLFNDIVFGFAGRISADKGCNELFNAFKKIIPQLTKFFNWLTKNKKIIIYDKS